MTGIVIGIGILLLLILVHELGHLLAARLFRLPIESFSIGLGPTLSSWRRGATTYRLRALPLGGYVRYGEHAPGDVRRPWKLAIVLLAGPVANVVAAAILLVAAAAGSGTASAVATGLEQTARFAAQITHELAAVLVTADFHRLGGPVLITEWAGNAAHAGGLSVLAYAAVLSLNLAIFNLLPIPVLDGGRVSLLLAEGLQGHPFKLRVQQRLAMSGLAMLLALSLIALANDLARL